MGKKRSLTDSDYRHSCEGERRPVEEPRSISGRSLSDADMRLVYDFYVSCAPTIDNGSKASPPLRQLKDYGWKDSKDLRQLEGLLLKASGISSFFIRKTDLIDLVLDAMDLGDSKICIDHPRCVLQMLTKVTLPEEGLPKVEGKEKRLVCLFRHIRNALAHGLIYEFDNGMLLLVDQAAEKPTAKILLKAQTLVDWIYVVDKGEKYYRRSQ